uniref:Uncharacterized protein n=1 Tax=Daphnia galeata TaxID=27404 RepID=A0A8J2RL59_9CRUS|nr:unnamed protein product [Daphnia galeata]
MVFLLLSTQHWNDNIVVELFSMAMGGTTTTTTASCGDSRRQTLCTSSQQALGGENDRDDDDHYIYKISFYPRHVQQPITSNHQLTPSINYIEFGPGCQIYRDTFYFVLADSFVERERRVAYFAVLINRQVSSSSSTFEMPQVKCIQSLREICLQFVVRNIDLWCKQSTSDLISIGPKISNNPFDQFPRVILEEIIIFYQRTTQRKSNGNIVLQHLMTPRLVRVLLPCDQELLELAVVRSPQLKHLELRVELFHGIFDSFPKFENLEVLHLPSETEDNSLQVIGSYCTKLRLK